MLSLLQQLPAGAITSVFLIDGQKINKGVLVPVAFHSDLTDHLAIRPGQKDYPVRVAEILSILLLLRIGIPFEISRDLLDGIAELPAGNLRAQERIDHKTTVKPDLECFPDIV
ncbi:hypothetical protein D3C73_1368060 [compost metagenome]